MALVTLATTLSGTGHGHQVYAGVVTLVAALSAQLYLKPYAEPRQGMVENASLVTSCVSLYAGMLFALGGLSQHTANFAIVVLLAANVGFLLLCMRVILTDALRSDKTQRLRSKLQASKSVARMTALVAVAGRRGAAGAGGGAESLPAEPDVELTERESKVAHVPGGGSVAVTERVTNPMWKRVKRLSAVDSVAHPDSRAHASVPPPPPPTATERGTGSVVNPLAAPAVVVTRAAATVTAGTPVPAAGTVGPAAGVRRGPPAHAPPAARHAPPAARVGPAARQAPPRARTSVPPPPPPTGGGRR